MKFSIYFLFSLFIVVGFQSYATHPISPSWAENNTIENQEKSKINLAEKILKSKIGKWVIKKFSNAKITSKQMNTLGTVSLIVGAVSLISLFLIFTVTWGWWVAFGLAILGDILSIITLINTAGQKKDFKKARTLAWIGLILSLLTGLLPLTLFILILISI